jgi:hypothetical protein
MVNPILFLLFDLGVVSSDKATSPLVQVSHSKMPSDLWAIHSRGHDRAVFGCLEPMDATDASRRFFISMPKGDNLAEQLAGRNRTFYELQRSYRYLGFDSEQKGKMKADDSRAEESGVGAQEGRVKAQEDGGKAQEGGVGAQESRVKAQEGGSKAQGDGVKAQEGGVKAQEDGGKAQEDGVKAQEDGVKAQEDGCKAQEDGGKAQGGGVKAQEDGSKAQKGDVKAQEDGVKAQETDVKAQKSGLRKALKKLSIRGHRR